MIRQSRMTDLISVQPALVLDGIERENGPVPEVSRRSLPREGTPNLPDNFREILHIASIAESVSEHPLARAIVEEAGKFSSIPEPETFQSYTGLGIEATYKSRQILVGSEAFMQKMNIAIGEQAQSEITNLSERGRTMVLVAIDGVFRGAVGISDNIRQEAAGMVSRLRENGIKQMVMITGDTRSTARAVAKEAGIDEVYARMLPEDKLDIISDLKNRGHRVAMIGDGINDAPAMAAADIGIAMGVAGTDVALETADIALMADELGKIPEALRISKRTLRNIRQNVIIALITVAALLTGVLMGSIHMAGGMLIHEASVMIVILNGMRLRWA